MAAAGSLLGGLADWAMSGSGGRGGKTSATGWTVVWVARRITGATATATGEGGAPAAEMTASGAVVGCLGGEGEVGTGESLRLFTDECLGWRRTLGEARGRREGERYGDRED